ncbi:unnamed protein product [Camellia sinensis]
MKEFLSLQNDDVKLHDDQSGFWNTLPISDDIVVKHALSNSRILEATSYGLGKLTATLMYSTGEDGTKEVLKYRCCAKVSSDYKWFSTDMGIVSVSAHGIVQAKKPGKATIKVVSNFDPFNCDEVIIEVSIPSSMVVLPNFPIDTTVGSHLQAAVTMKALNGESFTIDNVTGESFVVDMLYGPPCAWTYVYASSFGHTMLHATLSKEYQYFDHSFSGPVILKASLRIAAYPPLPVHQVGDGSQFGGYWFDLAQAEASNQLGNLEDLYLVPGTHLDVMLRGGPDRRGQGVEFIQTVETLVEHTLFKDGVVVHQISTSFSSPYRISCQKLGTFRIVCKRGNLVGDDHPLPAVAEVGLSLRYSFLSTTNKLDVIWSAIQADRGPGRVRATPITVANGRTVRVSSVGISDSGKAFGNSSALHLSWELSNCGGWHLGVMPMI